MAIPIKKTKPSKGARPESQSSLFDFMNKDISLFGNKLNDAKKEQIYTSLHSLLSAGIPIAQTLQTLIDESEKESEKLIIKNILDGVVGGSPLSKAMDDLNQFTNYEVLSIQIGEETGNLNQVLSELSVFFKQKLDQKRKLIGALSYPIVVLTVALVVVVFMLQVIVPMFADIFLRFGGELPWITKSVMNLSEFVRSNIYYLILCIVVIILIYLSQRKNERLRRFKDSMLFKIPVIKKLLLKIYLARFCRSMSFLIAAGIPITESLSIMQRMISFYPIADGSQTVKEAVLKGKSMYEGFAQAKVFPNKLLALVKIGEEVNKLEEMFTQLADQYSKETDYQLQIFNSLLEPFLIIFLAIVIGVILVAMYLPIFQLSSQMI